MYITDNLFVYIHVSYGLQLYTEEKVRKYACNVHSGAKSMSTIKKIAIQSTKTIIYQKIIVK
jgi:hypothetical protein